MAFLERLQQARNEAAKKNADPWRKKVAALVRDMDTVSTAALLDLLRVPATTATARRLAAIMRALNFIQIKSRRLMPGGLCGNTVTRGWARPVRRTKSSPSTKNAGADRANTLGGSHRVSNSTSWPELLQHRERRLN